MPAHLFFDSHAEALPLVEALPGVKRRGTPPFTEYSIAVAELDRLDAAARPGKP